MTNKNDGLISIVIPNYNSQDYISQTINSIINQTYTNFELLIIDDYSTDNSCKIIEKYKKEDDRIKLFVLEKNSGRPAGPRNYGLKQAKGEYIAFMDSDDIWHMQKLELQLKAMEESKIYFSSTELINFTDINLIQQNIDTFINKPIKTFIIKHNKLIKKNIIPNSSVIIKKEILGDLKFDEDKRYKAIEDFHLWLRVLQSNNKHLKLKEELLFYRLAETSISKSKFDMFKKNYMLYSEYEINGYGLGLKKYFYLLSYIYYSLIRIIKKKM